MLRSLKATIVDRLEALRHDTQWTREVTERALRQNLRDALRNSPHAIQQVRLESLLMFANHRMKLLWRTDVLLNLQKGKHPQWSVLDRTESERVDGFDLFASPDIVLRSQSKYILVRLDMQSDRMVGSDRLEALAMVVWSMQRKGLPCVAEQFMVRTLGWRKGAWVQNRVDVSTKEVMLAKTMIQHDVAAMGSCAKAFHHLPECVPLAKEESDCKGCKYKPKCLDGTPLEEVKRRRVCGLQLTPAERRDLQARLRHPLPWSHRSQGAHPQLQD
jgi:hypothetical protein